MYLSGVHSINTFRFLITDFGNGRAIKGSTLCNLSRKSEKDKTEEWRTVWGVERKERDYSLKGGSVLFRLSRVNYMPAVGFAVDYKG